MALFVPAYIMSSRFAGHPAVVQDLAHAPSQVHCVAHVSHYQAIVSTAVHGMCVRCNGHQQPKANIVPPYTTSPTGCYGAEPLRVFISSQTAVTYLASYHVD